MAEMKFEEALKKLEKVASELEKNDLSLDTALKKFEEGIKLTRLCSKRLKEAEKKIEVLVKDEEGNFQKKPFEASEKEKRINKKKEEFLF